MRQNVEGASDDLPDSDDFWLTVSQRSLDSIWDNSEDDIYATRTPAQQHC